MTSVPVPPLALSVGADVSFHWKFPTQNPFKFNPTRPIPHPGIRFRRDNSTAHQRNAPPVEPVCDRQTLELCQNPPIRDEIRLLLAKPHFDCSHRCSVWVRWWSLIGRDSPLRWWRRWGKKRALLLSPTHQPSRVRIPRRQTFLYRARKHRFAVDSGTILGNLAVRKLFSEYFTRSRSPQHLDSSHFRNKYTVKNKFVQAHHTQTARSAPFRDDPLLKFEGRKYPHLYSSFSLSRYLLFLCLAGSRLRPHPIRLQWGLLSQIAWKK